MSEDKKAFFADVPSRMSSDELERGVLAWWEEERVFERALEKTKDGELFTFYDGPPYATGKPHYGHVLQSAIKDTVLRYKTMRGFSVPRRVGWDCHGLPVETLVEKELGFKGKKDIEAYGIAEFNERCRETVFRYIDEFTATLKRLGRWADYEGAYATLDRDYMESEWWVFKQLWEQGLVYKAFRSTPYCIRCETPLSNFEVSMAYQNRTDTAVYVRLKVKGKSTKAKVRGSATPSPSDDANPDDDDGQLSLLVWTTTPWTLPANVAVAVGAEVTYVTAVVGDEAFIVAQDRVGVVLGDEAEVVKRWTTEELLELTYEPLFPEVARAFEEESEKLFTVVVGDHVTAEDGTGLVHMAPAFGEEDALVGKKEGLPVLKTITTDGRFTPEVAAWAGQNLFEANAAIAADLEKRGLLLKEEQYRHSYPHCWRCDEPLIYYALDTWFVKIEQFKEEMLANNEQISWTPKHVKHGRFGRGIESAPDWAVSRNRFWSVPLPVWECEGCEERTCVGSVEELAALAGVDDVTDLHRPYVDDLQVPCTTCDGSMKRVPEVLDVWFDSGSMPYSQWHYPFENKDFVEGGFPADFIAESVEMTRAWFYVLHVLAAALTREDQGLGKGQPAYKNVIASGLIFAEDGKKLSKKLKNYPEVEPTLEKFGADVMRLYLLSSTTLGEPYRFSEKDLQQVQRNVYLTWWNVYSFFVRYANVAGFVPSNVRGSTKYEVRSTDERGLLDRWMMARLGEFEREMVEATEAYQIDRAARAVLPFVDDVSNWYVRRSRDRFHPAEGGGQEDAFATLYEVLRRGAVVLAPYMPFVTEAMYRNLVGEEESVHWQQLGEPEPVSAADTALLEEMALVRAVVSEGLALRAREGIRVRQPLAELHVIGEEWAAELVEIVRDELNVKRVHFSDALPDGEGYAVSGEEQKVRVVLMTELTEELEQEGMVRDLIRQGQVLRRKAGYALDDRITVVLKSDDAAVTAAVAAQREMLLEALQADGLEEAGETDEEDTVKVGGVKVQLGVRK